MNALLIFAIALLLIDRPVLWMEDWLTQIEDL